MIHAFPSWISPIEISEYKNYYQRAKIGVSGNNVFLATKYVGYDPETSTFGAQALANNVDVAPYPTARRLFFHIQIDF